MPRVHVALLTFDDHFYDTAELAEVIGISERTLHLTRILNDDSDDTLTPGADTVTIVT